MSQQDAFKLLEEKGEWMTAKEIAEILNISNPSASLQRLYHYGEIMRKIIKSEYNGRRYYQYKIK